MKLRSGDPVKYNSFKKQHKCSNWFLYLTIISNTGYKIEQIFESGYVILTCPLPQMRDKQIGYKD